jgi:hypothetical protein
MLPRGMVEAIASKGARRWGRLELSEMRRRKAGTPGKIAYSGTFGELFNPV